MKKILIILLTTILGFIALSFLNPRNEVIAPTNSDIQNKNQISINGIKINIEIADDPPEQSQGLSGRESLGPNSGMLFVFPQPTMPSFWMKDMKFSLDLIWIDENGEIIAITENVSPATYPKTYQPPSPIKYVLEVNADWSDRNNIEVEDEVMGL